MAKKKQTLRTSQDSNISLIGISCHLKSYRLSFSMNKALNFRLQRIEDFEIPVLRDNDALCFPFLTHDDSDMKNYFCLISNHHPQGKLIPALRQVDYFLMAKKPLDNGTRNAIISKIRDISQVLAAYEIDTSGKKDLDLLLEEMELHLLTSGKNREVSQA